MARQFVGFDSLFEELNEIATRKESNYPAYNIAKDDEENYRIEVALAGFSADDIVVEREKGVLKVEAKKKLTNVKIIFIRALRSGRSRNYFASPNT
jgi:molecular chaperone IbpA